METVTTWIGVAGSAVSAVVTVVTLYVRAGTKRKIAAIEARTPEAARIVADAVTSFQIDTAGLTQEQKYSLARREITSRDRRHARVLWVSLALALVIATTTVALASLGSTKTAGDTFIGTGVHINTLSGSSTFNLPPPRSSGQPKEP
jgi:hypothetical protein